MNLSAGPQPSGSFWLAGTTSPCSLQALRDLLKANQFDVRYIIAPMVETPYALSKYIQAKNRVFSPEESEEVDCLFNTETVIAYNHLKQMIDMTSQQPGCSGLVFGLVDFAGSLGIGRAGIESDEVSIPAQTTAAACRDAGLDYVIGGAVSIDALSNLKHFQSVHHTRFETRKVVFEEDALNRHSLERSLKNAVRFELLWLLNKRDHYGFIHKEDEARIEMLESRWNVLGCE